jgi:signal transduction histidine kinase
MVKLNLRTKALLLALLLSIVVLGSVYFAIIRLEHSADEIIANSKLVTESAAYQLSISAKSIIQRLATEGYFQKTGVTRIEEKQIDSLLSTLTSKELELYAGMEGGFYFQQPDVFLGYSFPSSPAPKPAFGPPPRSYTIIRDQALESIQQRRRITQIHAFDPATFPLVTEPITVDGKTIGCAWARVHIERLIPTLQLTDVLLIAGIFLLVGFFILLAGAWNMRKKVEEIRLGLALLHTDDQYRFPNRRGVFGEITASINQMIDAREGEQQRRELLEHDLHQQDKMATLGTLIAGVAHEVKTPLAIIKTRIQMWEKKFEEQEITEDRSDIVSKESMNLVIGEINRLSDLVKRLLVFSKPVSNKLQSGNINQILAQIVMLVQSEATTRNIKLKCTPDPTVPDMLLDSYALEQVVLNIVTNSIEAMPHGGDLTMYTTARSNPKFVRIDIKDTGQGISPEIQEKIFNPFFTTKDHGVGLGLSISYEIIRAHHGTIEFLPSEQTGTHCRIILPVEPPKSKKAL